MEQYTSYNFLVPDVHKQKNSVPPIHSSFNTFSVRFNPPSNKCNAPSVIEAMPFDILFEVFGYFEPKELLVLARLNRGFREHLLSRDAQSMWHRARRNMDPVCPSPHAWCSELKWAEFLFAGQRCQTCGTKGQNWPDFSLVRRMCTPCARSNLVARGSFRKAFPEYDIRILEVVPFTSVGTRSRPTNTKFYWISDIHNAAAKMTQLQNDVILGKEGAGKALEDWMEGKRKMIPPAQVYIEAREKWLLNYVQERNMQKGIQRYNHRQRWVNEFVNMGYTNMDVYAMLARNNVTLHNTPITDASLAKARARWEPLIIKERTRRLGFLFTSCFKSTYEAWFIKQSPQSWYHLPPLRLLRIYQPVIDILKLAQAHKGQPDPDHFAYLVDHFSEICEGWRQERAAYLRGLMEAGNDSEGNALVNEELAVFKCPDCHAVLFGIGEAAIHMNNSCHGKLEHCSDQGMYIARLVQAMGKDPLSAKPLDLDLLDCRFRCLACMGRFKASWQAFTWRQIVEHSYVPKDHPAELISDPSVLADIEGEESGWMSQKAWICAHCSEFWYECSTIEEMVDHNEQSHDIASPIEPADFTWVYNYPRARIRDPVEILTGEEGDHPQAHAVHAI